VSLPRIPERRRVPIIFASAGEASYELLHLRGGYLTARTDPYRSE
jgi:hypothetical protein